MRDLHRGDADAFLREQRPAFRRLIRQDAVGRRRIHLFERLVQGAHEVVAHVGEHAAERRRDAGVARHQHMGHAELAGDGGGVHRPGAAEGEEREVARVVPLVHRDQPRRARHLVVHHLQDRRRGPGLVEAERVADPGADDAAHRVDVRRAVEAADGAGVDAAEQQVGVGHGRLGTALAVADRPRRGARALRPHAQDAALVHPRDAAAAGADGLDVHHRHAERHAVGDVLLRRRRRHAAAHDGDVEAGAAHVAADEVGEAGGSAEVRGGDDAGGRPRHDRLHRLLAGDAGGHHAAVALHHQQLGLAGAGAQPAGDALQVAGHDGLDVAVERGGAAALELAHLAQYVGAQGDVDLGPDLARERTGPAFVVGIEIGVDEVDDQRLGAGRVRRPGGLPHLVFVELGHHRAGGIDPLGDLEAALARDDRLEVTHHAPRVGPGAAAELQRVAEALGGDQGAAHPLALQHGVGADRGAVDHRLQPARRRAERGEARHEPSDWSAGVDGTLAIRMAPEAGSTSSRSVKVPPTSTPSRQRPGAALMSRRRRLRRPPGAGRPRPSSASRICSSAIRSRRYDASAVMKPAWA